MLVAELTGEKHPVVQAELMRQLHERGIALAAAGEYEGEIGMVWGDLSKSMNQPRQVFVRQTVAQSKDKRPFGKMVENVSLCTVLVGRMAQVKLSGFRVARVPSGSHAVEDGCYFVGWYAVVERRLARAFRDSDDVVGCGEGSADTEAAQRSFDPAPPASAVGEMGVIHPDQIVQGDDDAPSAHADGEKVV